MTNRQRVFIDEYLKCWNGTQAARIAGYKNARQSATENLAKPYIQEAIQQRLAEITMSADEVLARLTRHARGDFGDFIQVNSLGWPVAIDLEKAQEAQDLGLIKKLTIDGRGRITVELYDAQNALIWLGKHYELFTDRVKIDDWQAKAIEGIREQVIAYEPLAEEFGYDIATELFRRAGVPVHDAVSPGQGENQE